MENQSNHILRFLWWNVQDFAHFDITRTERDRWPKTQQIYESKSARVLDVLRAISEQSRPQFLAFAEITHTAATRIQSTLFPTYKVHELGAVYPEPDFRLAVIYDPKFDFENEDFLAPSAVPSGTRPMTTLEYFSSDQRIRFYACHWTAPFDDNSEKWRIRAAQALNEDVYNFLHPRMRVQENRHVVILGDLNEEPFDGTLEKWLYASRTRTDATRRSHYTD